MAKYWQPCCNEACVTSPALLSLHSTLRVVLLLLLVLVTQSAVVLACRSASKGEAMVAQLRKEAAAAGSPAPHLEVNLLDLASLESVRQFVERWQQRPLHVLVNNAGMFNMGGAAGSNPCSPARAAHAAHVNACQRMSAHVSSCCAN